MTAMPSLSTSVVIPALNEEHTVARVVRHALADNPLEVLVIDADSTDRTAIAARDAGARVVNWRDVLPEVPPSSGKGESLWRGVAAARGDIVVFCDADLTTTAPGMTSALALPFHDPAVHLVKASYRRTFRGLPDEGGRVTELTAKPLLELFYPELADVTQPLGGEYAIRRDIARKLPFVGGYGVEVALLIDVAQRWGSTAVRQVDLGTRSHRNRPLVDLRPMARVVAATVLQRAGKLPAGAVSERPPLDTLAG